MRNRTSFLFHETKLVITSEESVDVFCLSSSTIGMSMNSLFHFRGWISSPSITLNIDARSHNHRHNLRARHKHNTSSVPLSIS
jgi:hypothetical protein